MTETAFRSTPRRGTLGRLSFSLGWSAIAVVAASCGGDAPATLAGAEQLAAGGHASWSDVSDMLRSEDPDEVVHLDDLPLEEAALVLAAEGENLAILFEARGVSDGRVVASPNGGAIGESTSAIVSASATQTAGHITASGRFVTAADGDVGRALSGNPFSPDEIAPENRRITVYDPVAVPIAEYPLPFPVGALDLAEDGTVLAGGLDDSRIARIDAGGTTTHLLGPAGSDARVTGEHDLGRVVAVMLLDDDRVVFVAGTEGDTHLYLLDGTAVRQIPGDDQGNPVAGTDERRMPDLEDPYPRAAITPLAPSPDGRVLATGIAAEGNPQISLVDVDTGDIEVLATLDEVEPTIDDPVSAAIVGTDLIFLAQHQLWRLPDVIPSDDT